MEIEMDHVANLRSFANLYIAESKAQLLAAADELESLKSKLGEVQSAYDAVLKRMHEEHEIRIDLGNRLEAEVERRIAAEIAHGKVCDECDELREKAISDASRLSAVSKLLNDWAEAERLGGAVPILAGIGQLREALNSSVVEKPCTCHPDDNPPRPCPRKYALTECRKAAACE